MKKNIVFLLIDCFDYNKIGSNQFRESPSPFLDELKTRSYWCEKMYSSAPYTEAALISTICGYDTLDHGGHLKRYKDCPETLYEMMQRAGYFVYAQMWTHFYPSSALRGLDEYHLRPYNIKQLWSYRFCYYSGLYKNNKLYDQDYENLEDILRDNFNHIKSYYEMLVNHDERVDIILNNMKLPDIGEEINKLEIEIRSFNENPKLYIQSIFDQGESHKLFSLYDKECLDYKIPDEFKYRIYSKYHSLGEKIYKLNNSLNRKNCQFSWRQFHKYWELSSFKQGNITRSEIGQYLRNLIHVAKYKELKNKFGINYPLQKDCISVRSMMNIFLEWEKKRKNKDKPFFAYIHSDDIHGQSEIFDICSVDEKEIDSQVNEIKDYLKKLPNNYQGNLGYDLGILNVDRQIKWFFQQLESNKMLDNTIVIITADHGCGQTYNPIRGLVQNFHDECYHIPFMIYDKSKEGIIDSDLHLSKDIMATLADLVDVEQPKSCTGVSILSGLKRSFLLQEYMGPGCPDIYRRPIWMCAFDKEWKVFIKVRLNQSSFKYDLYELYHISEDPLELKNLSHNKKAVYSTQYLINELNKRWNDLRTEYPEVNEYE